ncbi:MAG: sigma-70 family RNA polymerase sigma factor [Verrucomicrobiaceae bacterium]|nr:sigma-70 family RNA polymerase sigma factor [Verrucomicrobiaceae bacterium]
MPDSHDQDEASVLVRRALDQYESSLIAYAAGILGGDIERARDVVQDALLRLYLTEPGKVRENLKSWLYTVCRNRALDILRKDHRLDIGNEEIMEASPAHGPDPVQFAANRELYEQIWRCVDRLRPNQREVVRLKFLHDCSYQEIASITGLTVGNVGFIMHHAIKKLRELLSNDIPAEHLTSLSSS